MLVSVLKLHGLKCPLPVLKTSKALAKMKSGDAVQVECTDEMAAIDIPHLVNQTGNSLDSFEKSSDGVLIFRIRKTASV